MTDAYPPPYQFPAPEPSTPKRPLFGKIIAWLAIVFGTLFLIASVVNFQIGGLLVGLFALAAGVVYLKAGPSAGRKPWAVPALAILPAFVVLGLTAPSTSEQPVSDVAAVASLPSVAPTTSARPTTTAPKTTAPTTTTVPPTTTVAPPVETVTVYAPAPTTVPYVPAPAAVPTPEPVYTQPAPLVAAVPEVAAPPAASVIYANCAAAKAAGAAPLYIGGPGYQPKLDGDHDGVACEK